MNEELISKLHEPSYVMTQKEIDDLQELCYSNTNSYFPIGDFFNDIRDTSVPGFNKNQAYKDLYLIMLHFNYYYEKSSVQDIIKEHFVKIGGTRGNFEGEKPTNEIVITLKDLTEKEFDLIEKYVKRY